MITYKRNLLLISSRYGDLEQRVLKLFARKPEDLEIWLLSDLEILLIYLLEDGLLSDTGQTQNFGRPEGPTRKLFRLTQKGRDFVGRWMTSEGSK
jgi:hypothetical protein